MSGNMKEIEINLLIEKDDYYFLADIPNLFNLITEKASTKMINQIMESFLEGKFLEDLKIAYSDSESSVIDLQSYKCLLKISNNQKWESVVESINSDSEISFYKPYVDQKKLMIHVTDIMKVLNNYKLGQYSKELSIVLGKKASKKRLNSKRDQEIIRLYHEIKKQHLNLSDSDIAERIKVCVEKDKRKTGDIIKIKQKISDLNSETIANIITKYYGELINKRFKEYWIHNEIKLDHIIYGIKSKEKEKENKAQSIQLNVQYKKGYCYDHTQKSYICNNNTDFYDSNKKFIDSLYKRHGIKPTKEQVIEALDEEFIKFTAKNIQRLEHGIRRIILNMRKKQAVINDQEK